VVFFRLILIGALLPFQLLFSQQVMISGANTSRAATLVLCGTCNPPLATYTSLNKPTHFMFATLFHHQVMNSGGETSRATMLLLLLCCTLQTRSKG
jgi:hypothetical protein